jgi:hypothetical protein
MSQADLWAQAKQGNAQAIGLLMNQQLQPKGIRAQAVNEQGHLKITFEARVVPPEQPLIAFTRRGLEKLGITGIDVLTLYGKQISSPAMGWQWQQDLPHPATVTPPESPQNPEIQPETEQPEQVPERVVARTHSSSSVPARASAPAKALARISRAAEQVFSQPMIGLAAADPEDTTDNSVSPESVMITFTLYTAFSLLGFAFLYLLPSLGGILIMAALVCLCIAVYRHTTLLQGHGTKIQPVAAVGYSFVPLFCFYWWFVTFVGLAQDSNRYLQRHQIPWPRMNRQLSLILCYLACIWAGTWLIHALPLHIPGAYWLNETKNSLSYLVLEVVKVPLLIIGFLVEENRKNCVLAMINYRQLYGNTNLPATN